MIKGKIKILILVNKVADRTDALGIKMLQEIVDELENVEDKDYEPGRSTNTV